MTTMPPEDKTVFLHVGCRKSGTSALQRGLAVGAEPLREAGLHQPLLGRGATTSHLVRPLQRAAEEGNPAAARKVVSRFAKLVEDHPAPRHLVSLEALAELPAEVTAVVVEELADVDLRVVVTARPWALVIPSEWQQRVKSRGASGYDEYTRTVRNPEAAGGLAPEAAAFHRRQDLADIARRWKAGDPDLPLHVVLVPPRREGQPGLVDLFADLVGVEPALLHVPDRNLNPSLGYAEAEILRHVNLALGNRLHHLRGDYRYSVRKWLAQRMMKGSQGSRIRIPREFEAWAVEESARQVGELPGLGVDVRGDVQGFSRPDLPGDDFVRPSDAEILQRAGALLADLAVEHERNRKRAGQTSKRGGSARPGARRKSRRRRKSGR
jgi:hypothetical protein